VTILSVRPTSKPQNLLIRKEEDDEKMPLLPKLVACTSVLAIGVYGYSINTKVMPSMVGVGFLYGAYHLRKEYKNNSYILPLLAGIGCFAIQTFVVRVPQKI